MARRGTSRGIGRGTPIFSFETPSRERSSHSINRRSRELIRNITGPDHSPSHRPNSTSVTPTGTPNRQSNSITTPLSVNNAASDNPIPPEAPLTNNSAGLADGSIETTQTRLGVYFQVPPQ